MVQTLDKAAEFICCTTLGPVAPEWRGFLFLACSHGSKITKSHENDELAIFDAIKQIRPFFSLQYNQVGTQTLYGPCGTGATQVPFPTWRCHHPLPLLEEAGLEAISRTKVVRLVSGHQFLHWLQNHTQLVGKAKRTLQDADGLNFNTCGSELQSPSTLRCSSCYTLHFLEVQSSTLFLW